MDNIKAIFELSRAAMLAVEKGRITAANSRARELFGTETEGRTAVGIVPDHILANSSGSFTATALIAERPYSISAVRTEGRLILSIAEDLSDDAAPEFISDTLLSAMHASLFNISLAIDRVDVETAGSGSEKLEDYLAILRHSYYSLRHSMLNLSTSIALRKGSLFCSFRAVELAGLCSDLCSTVAVMCSARGIDIDFSTSIGELYAYADGEKLERIILNLITNSITHTPKGGKISIGLEKSSNNAYISVTDTGSGIPPAEMAEVFTKYRRESRSPDLSSLSAGGLGLGVARGLAEVHGGALIIESREGMGTCVRVLIPLKSYMLSILESGNREYDNNGMSLILTELSGVLDSSSYGRKYTE